MMIKGFMCKKCFMTHLKIKVEMKLNFNQYTFTYDKNHPNEEFKINTIIRNCRQCKAPQIVGAEN